MPSITVKEYFAVDGSNFSNKEARQIGPVLTELAEEGKLTASAVVEAAHSSNSPLYEFFEWNDPTAAALYREEQARRMIRSIQVRVVSGDKEIVMRAFTAIRVAGVRGNREAGRYAPVEVMNDESVAALQMMDTAVADARAWGRKYGPYVNVWESFAAVFLETLAAIRDLDEVADASSVERDTQVAVSELLAWLERHEATMLKHHGDYIETLKAVVGAIAALELKMASGKNTGPKERTCLKCGTKFMSMHAGHRRCQKCSNKTVSGGLEEATFNE